MRKVVVVLTGYDDRVKSSKSNADAYELMHKELQVSTGCDQCVEPG